jgi:hypothetical protein
VVPYEGVCTNAHGFDVFADSAALVSHVPADVFGCAQGGAHDTKAVYLDYIKVVNSGAFFYFLLHNHISSVPAKQKTA